MVAKMIYMSRDVVNGMLAYFRSLHPKEGILLMRGKVKKDVIYVEQLILPPRPTLAEDFSSFSLYDLPLDLSVLGIAHSHPNGVQEPSLEDLCNFYGRFMVIAAYPYSSEADIAVFDKEGNRVVFKVI